MQADVLGYNSSYTQALCIAITVFLHIVRPSTAVDNHLVPRLASKLMESLDLSKIRFRSSLNMLFCQYMVGAVASAGTPARQVSITRHTDSFPISLQTSV